MTSAFQTLPNNIIGLVYDTVASHRKWQWPWEVDDDEQGVAYSYLPLLSTCQRWRNQGVRRAYGCITISVCTNDDTVKVCYRDFSCKFIEPTHPCIPYVHTVELSLDFDSVLSGKVLEVLESSIYSELVIPKAQELLITFSDYRKDNVAVPDRALPFMRALATKLKSIIPMAKKINASCHLGNFKADKIRGELLGRFVRLLYSNSHKFRAVNFNTPMSSSLVPNFTSGITMFDTDWKDHYELKARIAHLNALTLQYLSIKFAHTKDIHTLINSHEDYIVVYPNLNFLAFTSGISLNQSTKPMLSKEAVPFPKLKYFYLDMDYPFADDVLYRGNSNVLEYLRIKPDIEAIYMMDRHGMFTGTKYRRLKHVVISKRQAVDAPKRIIAQFVLGVSSHAQVLDIKDATIHEEFVQSAIRAKSLNRLQQLHVSCFELTLCEIINLLGSLPSLTHLASCEPELGHQFDEMEVEELGEYMLMSYFPLSKTFRKWACYTSATSTVEVVSLCAVLLAIACPRLSCASVLTTRLDRYSECVRDILSFEPYASFIDLVEPLPDLIKL